METNNRYGSVIRHLTVEFIVSITLIGAACQTRELSSQVSGGLGLSRPEWERRIGSAVNTDSGYVYYHDTRGGFILNFMSGAAGYIKRTYSTPSQMSLEAARKESRQLIPNDSKLIRVYNAPSGPVDLYASDSLKQIFLTDDYWIKGEPGNFIVSYSFNGGLVDSFVVGLGNNP
jgi:hypothetical protein